MGGHPPPPPGGDDPFPPPGGGPPPPPGPGGWPAPTPPGPPSYAGAGSAAGPFAPPGAYAPGPGYGYGYSGYAEKAGFWARFAAFLLDAIIVGLFSIPAYIALAAGPTRRTSCRIEDGTVTSLDDNPNAICDVPTGGTWAAFAILLIAAFVAAVIYYGKMDGGPSGATVGKKALGIRVVDKNGGGPIGTGRGVGRYFARILSALVCYLGYLWMLWDPEKQCWHDKLVNCYVVKAQP